MNKIFYTSVLLFLMSANVFAQNPYNTKLEGLVIADTLEFEDEQELSDTDFVNEPIFYRVLQLNQPKNLFAVDVDGNIEKFSDISKIQFAGGKYQQIYDLPIPTKIRVTCELFIAHTAYHYTDVLCDVKDFKRLK